MPPAYERIAAEIRAGIADGTYEPGARLPSVRDLAKIHGVSSGIAQSVYRLLVREGDVENRPGSGYFVRVRPAELRLARGRYQRTGSPFARDMAAVGKRPGWEARSEIITAPPTIAARLGIEPGAEVTRTSYVYFGDGKPVQTATSYEPRALTAGTPVEIPEEGDYAGSGVIARMGTIGHEVTEVVEEIVTRLPTRDESELLAIPAGVPVFVIERTHHADVPVETCDIVIPGDRYRLVYRVPVV